MSIENHKSLGIAMNGGALRCAYYIGVFQYIYENKIIVDEIITISSGFVPALIYFSGQRPIEIFAKFTKKLSQERLKPKIFSLLLKNFIDICFLEDKDVLKLNNKLKVITTKMKNLKPVIFDNFTNKIELNNICEASSSFPYFINFPVKIKNNYYIDGGLSKFEGCKLLQRSVLFANSSFDLNADKKYSLSIDFIKKILNSLLTI